MNSTLTLHEVADRLQSKNVVGAEFYELAAAVRAHLPKASDSPYIPSPNDEPAQPVEPVDVTDADILTALRDAPTLDAKITTGPMAEVAFEAFRLGHAHHRFNSPQIPVGSAVVHLRPVGDTHGRALDDYDAAVVAGDEAAAVRAQARMDDATAESREVGILSYAGDESLPVTDRDMIVYLLRFFDSEGWECPSCGYCEDTVATDVATTLRVFLKTHPHPLGDHWTCFHCGETFAERAAAALHFGTHESQHPACTIDVAAYRRMESKEGRYLDEDSDLHREMHRMEIAHRLALRRAEEAGYVRALKDTGYVVPTGENTGKARDVKVLTTPHLFDRIEAVARQADSAMQSNDEKHLRNTLETIADDLTAVIAAERGHIPTGDPAGQGVDWTDNDVETLRCLRDAVGKYVRLSKLWVPPIDNMLSRARLVTDPCFMPGTSHGTQPPHVGLPDGWKPSDPDVRAWMERNDLPDSYVDQWRVAIDDARSMHLLSDASEVPRG